MASKASARFTVDIDGGPRVLLSMRPSQYGDLFLVLKRGGTFRDFGRRLDEPGTSADHGRKILEQRYSIHPSVNSSSGSNTIKQTIVVEGRPKIETVLYTTAIKQKSGFAILFRRKAFKLSSHHFHPTTSKGTNFSIGKMSPEFFTLFYAVLVSASNVAMRDDHDLRFIKSVSHVTGEYRVTILYTYFSLPSPNLGTLLHTVSNSPRVGSSPNPVEASRILPAVDEVQAVADFNRFCTDTTNEFNFIFAAQAEKKGQTLPYYFRWSSAAFYPEGSHGTEAWDDYKANLGLFRNFGFII